MRQKETILVLILLAAALAPAGARGAEPSFAGHWKGSILIAPGVAEIGFTIDLAQSAAGVWTGSMVVPLFQPENAPLQKLAVQGRTISFERAVAEGVRLYSGTLSETGEVITGNYVKEDGKIFPRELRRSAPDAGFLLSDLRDLASGAPALKELFNQDAGRPRLVLLLQPSSQWGNTRVRMVQKYLLDLEPNGPQRVYAVWISMTPSDTRDAAKQAMVHLSDHRVTHFWLPDAATANALEQPFGLQDAPVYELYLAYSPAARWDAALPKPDVLQHMAKGLPAEQKFDAVKLNREVRSLARP